MKKQLDLFQYVSFKTVSAGFLLSLAAAWIYLPALSIGLAAIGLPLLICGEWYAREIYNHPMPETYKSVVIGLLIIVTGFTACSTLVNVLTVSRWLNSPLLVWCVILAGGPQISWQRRKIIEDKKDAARGKSVFGSRLRRNK